MDGEQSHVTRPVIPTNVEGSPGTIGISGSARNDNLGRDAHVAFEPLKF